jgi:predicted pyridoxine 5'-phosphate oxidase superfamily flavin-nucleotide-binding protein
MSTNIHTGWPFAASPFHRGERAVQERLGVREEMEGRARVGIRDFMPDQHRQFFAQLPLVLVGSEDADGQPWASVMAAPPGFMQAPDAQHLTIKAPALTGDPLRNNLAVGAQIGLLGIEPHTRRRNRMNGVVSRSDADGFSLRVTQSFGNCPKYIVTREAVFAGDGDAAGATGPQPVERLDRLDHAMRAMIERADTYFIASAFEGDDDEDRIRRGVDVSHRGGKAGFVRVDDDQTLVAPEYVGNNFFNTTGNLVLNPRAGLLFIDFDSGDLLYLAVSAEVVWDGAELASFAGAQRLLRFHVRQALLVKQSLPLRWR